MELEGASDGSESNSGTPDADSDDSDASDSLPPSADSEEDYGGDTELPAAATEATSPLIHRTRGASVFDDPSVFEAEEIVDAVLINGVRSPHQIRASVFPSSCHNSACACRV